MIIFMAILVGGTGYVISRLVDIYTTSDPNKYLSCKSSLSLFESVVIVLAIVTIIFAYLNFRNFGRGLQDQLRRRSRRASSIPAGEDHRLKNSASTISLASSIFKWDPRNAPPMPDNIPYNHRNDNSRYNNPSIPPAYPVAAVSRYNEPNGAIPMQHHQQTHHQHQQFVAPMSEKPTAISIPSSPTQQFFNRQMMDSPNSQMAPPQRMPQGVTMGLPAASIPAGTQVVIGPNGMPLAAPKRKYTPEQMAQKLQRK